MLALYDFTNEAAIESLFSVRARHIRGANSRPPLVKKPHLDS
jgi:hypothetical protein